MWSCLSAYDAPPLQGDDGEASFLSTPSTLVHVLGDSGGLDTVAKRMYEQCAKVEDEKAEASTRLSLAGLSSALRHSTAPGPHFGTVRLECAILHITQVRGLVVGKGWFFEWAQTAATTEHRDMSTFPSLQLSARMECAACGHAVKEAACPSGCPRALAEARLKVNVTAAIDDGTAEVC